MGSMYNSFDRQGNKHECRRYWRAVEVWIVDERDCFGMDFVERIATRLGNNTHGNNNLESLLLIIFDNFNS